MTNILLNGCMGKMGKTVTRLAKDNPDINIAAGIDRNISEDNDYPVFSSVKDVNIDYDVLLDFSRPDSLYELLSFSIKNKKPIILCTTGYTEEQLDKIKEAAEVIPVFRSANMSLGVNVMSQLLNALAPILYGDFDIEIIEKHHNEKVDSPSGTALLLADSIRSSLKEETHLVLGRNGNKKRDNKDIGIHAIRGGSIVGDHEVIFASKGEIIEITHKAMSRDVFAYGALKACSFIIDKPAGLYDMNDVVNLKL
ncbi:4-hydroxy-tetrahydrodipicolinate reductase [Alloiococcus sp. CFN-8]|uniref:4-hydroxy-tetrahydrodipicolinate reductase n=1 Tax=Alloiococcus sp. CFN-8 TaxID=3416081 RepID=UPI003CF630AA